MTEFQPRDPETLVTLEVDDRRRLAMADLRMQVEARPTAVLLPLGEVVLRHTTGEDEDVLALGDKLMRRLG
jgi:hypothetical protein